MEDQTNLDFGETGRMLRDEGIAAALSPRGGDAEAREEYEAWKEAFRCEAMKLCAGGGEFTSEDVTGIVGGSPAHPNAVGAMMMSLVTMKLIKSTGKIKRAKMTSSHAAMLRVWTIA